MNDIDATKKLRVSVATLNRVLFPHPQDGTIMLALERKATVLEESRDIIHVRAQPFGGGVRILNPASLKEIVGELQFDNERSGQEGDFRILIPPSKWGFVKEYCLYHLENSDDGELESLPHRELIEEFAETINVNLNPDQYTVRPLGFVVEDNPVPTDNANVRGQLTVRLYRTFKVCIVDNALSQGMLTASLRYSDHDLGTLALKDFHNGGRGRANSILTLPLRTVTESYLALPPEMRYRKIVIENHELDESLLAILGDVDVPQYQKV